MKKTKTNSALSAAVLTQMSSCGNSNFYRKFLAGDIGKGSPFSPWVVTKLVADGRIGEATLCLRSGMVQGISKKEGESMEWALIFLKAKDEANTALQKSIRRLRAVSEEQINNRWSVDETLQKRGEAIEELRRALVNALEGVETRKHYQIKTGWIKDAAERLW